MVFDSAPSPSLRTTNIIAFAFAAAALAAVLLSVFVMASRPSGCSAGSDSSVFTCDWVTSRVIAGVFLAAALVVTVVSWKRWKLALAIISAVLLAVGLVSVISVFLLAPAALWFGCSMWLWVQGRQFRLVLSALASIVLLYLAMNGVMASFVLYFTPI